MVKKKDAPNHKIDRANSKYMSETSIIDKIIWFINYFVLLLMLSIKMSSFSSSNPKSSLTKKMSTKYTVCGNAFIIERVNNDRKLVNIVIKLQLW